MARPDVWRDPLPRGIGSLDEETPEMHAEARMVVQAEAELQEDDLTLPVIPPERMPECRREWMRRPYLRCLIRAAQHLRPEQRRRSRTLQGLWEMSRSPEWRRQPGGRIPVEFAPLLEPGEAPR